MKGVADFSSTLVPARQPKVLTDADARRLRREVGRFVGLTFFGPLLRQASNSRLKGKYGHGGRGEEIFRGQLNELLAQRIGESGRFGIIDEMVRRLSTPAAAAVQNGVGGEVGRERVRQ